MTVTVPDSLAEALGALASRPEATVLAGGTDLMVEVNDGRRAVADVVVVNRVPELREIRYEPGVAVIGAAVTFGEIERLGMRVGYGLARAARTVGSPQIRNAATIGGNLGTASPAGDAHPVLVAAGATIEVDGPEGRRSIPAVDYFVGPKRSALRPAELVVAVRMPVRRGAQLYMKVGVRNAMVIAVASFAIAVDMDARTFGIGLGSVGPVPLAAPEVCAWASTRAEWRNDVPYPVLDDADLAEFARRVAAVAQPIDDHRSTARYRRSAVRVLARRALRRCVG